VRRIQTVDAFCPTLVLPECAAAIVRPTGDIALARELVALIQGLGRLNLVSLDPPLARRAAEIATVYRLRGADAAYAAVAEAFGATLVTWDVEVLQRALSVAPTATPSEWLKQNKG
jgi:predicted nucleic acid-binding protein